VLGVGFGEAVLAPAFARDERVRVVGFCAHSLDRARTAATRFGVAHAWDDWRAALDSNEVDAVAIAVPPVLQPEIAREALRRGKHVFCEKPIAVDRHDADDLALAATKAAVAHAVDFEFCELASFRRAYELAHSDAWLHFALTWRVETRANRLGAHPWKTATVRGGGALLGFGPHAVHAVEWLFGRISRLSARIEPREAEADTCVDAWLELENGVRGTLSIATDALQGSGLRLEAYGANRSMVLENQTTDHLRNFVLTTRHREDAAPTIVVDERPAPGSAAPQGDGRIEPVASLAKRFVDAALGGQAVRPNLEDGARNTSVLDAMRTAHATRAWQEIR